MTTEAIDLLPDDVRDLARAMYAYDEDHKPVRFNLRWGDLPTWRRNSYVGAAQTALAVLATRPPHPDPDASARVLALVGALKPLLAGWRGYLASDLNHECAHRHLVKYEAWGAVEDALIALFEGSDS